ncbi:hypothetical protein Vafri_421 [Volvox africanus]|nr:hypothetical protein Vafri_421 [Volvox africanus]
MTRGQGLSCGSAPWPYSAPSSYAAPVPVNCKSGLVVSTAFQRLFLSRGSRIRGQLSEATRSGIGHSADAVSTFQPAMTSLTLQTHPMSQFLGACSTGTRQGAVLAGQRGRAARGGPCVGAANTPSAGKRLDGLNQQDSARQSFPSGRGTRAAAVVDAVATVLGAVAVGSGPSAPWRDANSSGSANGIGITREPDGANGGNTTADAHEGCSQPGDAARGDSAAASHDRGLACGGQGLRQGNWRVAWWDTYEREVQAAAGEFAALVTSVQHVESAADTAPRPERMEPTRHHTGPVNAVLSRQGHVHADETGSKHTGATGFNGPAVKRRRLDVVGKPGKEAGRARFPLAVDGNVVLPEVREAPVSAPVSAPALKAIAVAAAGAAEAAAAAPHGSISDRQPIPSGFSTEVDPVLSDTTGQGSQTGLNPLPAGSSTGLTVKRIVATNASTTTLDTAMEIGVMAAAADEAKAPDANAGAGVEGLLVDTERNKDSKVDGGRDEGPDVIPPFLDPDQERGRLSASRIEALYHIRELVLRRVTASADVRLLADALDWCVPLMDLKAVREAFRMIRTASVSVAFPRNSQLMPRPRFLSSFHFVARRLHCLLEVYGTCVMDWPFLLCVAGGMSAGRIRDRELMQLLHDRGLEMLRQSEEARQRWDAAAAAAATAEGEGEGKKQEQRKQDQQGCAVAAVTEAGTTGEEAAGVITQARGETESTAGDAADDCPLEHAHDSGSATSTSPHDTQPGNCSWVSGAGRAVDTAGMGIDEGEGEAQGAGAGSGAPLDEGIGSPHGGGRWTQSHGRGRRASKAAHVPIIGIRDLVCRFLLPLHHLGQPIDSEYLQLLEGMLARALPSQALAAPAVAVDTANEEVVRGCLSVAQADVGEAVGGCDGTMEGSVSEQLHQEALKPPPKLWLLRDVLELYSLVNAPPSPVLLRGIQEGCIAAAAVLHAAAAATPGAAEATRSASWLPVTDGEDEGCCSGDSTSDCGEIASGVKQQRGRSSGRGLERTRSTALKGLKTPRTWARATHAPGSTIPVASAAAGGDKASDVRRDDEILAGTLASVLYLLSRVVRRNGGSGFYNKAASVNNFGTECSSSGTGLSPSAGFGRSPWDLAWAHEALETLGPWMHTLTPLQLSGMLRTVVWLGAADRLLLPPPLPLSAGQAQALGPRSGSSGGTASAAVAAQRQQRRQQQARPTAFLESYFLALSRAVSEQPTAGTVTIGNVVEAAVGIAAAGVAAYGVPLEARDLYAKLLFRANVIMAYQATQRNGFLPPYALNLVPALSAAVRDAGSAAAVPAKLVAENLRLGERLLPGWHADGLAQVAAALETMDWVAPPGGWVDSFYAAVGQRLHASLHMPAATAAPSEADNSLVTVIDGALHHANSRPAADGHNGDSATVAAAGVSLFPPPRQPDSLGPASLIALLRAARHLARVASPRPEAAGAATAVTATATAGVTTGSKGGTATLVVPATAVAAAAATSANIAPSPAPLCGVMPESLVECLAARLGHMLAEGQGLQDEELMDLILLCQQSTLSSPAAATPVIEGFMTCSSSSSNSSSGGGGSRSDSRGNRGSRGQGFDEAAPSMMLTSGDITGVERPVGVAAHGGSLALMLLDALAEESPSLTQVAPDLATPEDSVSPYPSRRSSTYLGNNICSRSNSKDSSRPPAPPSGGGGGPAAATALAETRTRHIILSALEQALALQLRCQCSAVGARGVVALSCSLEQVLGRAPGPAWRTAVRSYLEARCDAALAEVRSRSEVAAAPLAAPQVRPHVAAFGVVQSAVDLLDAPVTLAATEEATAAGVGSLYSSSALGPAWWREVSYSAGVCIDYFRRGRGTSPRAFMKGGVSGTSAKTIIVAAAAWAPSSALAPEPSLPPQPPAAHAASLPKSLRSTDQKLNSEYHTDPDLAQSLDLIIRYSQHLGRWLAANRVVDPGQPAEAAVPVDASRPSLEFMAPSPQIQEQPQPPYPPQVAGLLRPHIYFLTGLFSLLQPLLQLPLLERSSNNAGVVDSSLAAAPAWAVLHHAKDHLSRGKRSLARSSPLSPAATMPSACAVAAAPAGLGPAAYAGTAGGHGDGACQAPATVSASQLVCLAELLALSRFKPLRFPSLVGWPNAYLEMVESQLPLLSSVDACMVVRALSCQGWRPKPKLMDALLDRVLADGGLMRVRTAYGPASLVQMLSWLAYARFLPAADWMETILGELGPYLDSISMVISGNGSGSRPLRLGSCTGGSSCSNGSSSCTCTISNSVGDQESLRELVLKRSSSHEEYRRNTVDRGVSDRSSGDGSSNCTTSSTMGSNTSTCDSTMISSSGTSTGNVPMYPGINFGPLSSSTNTHCSGSIHANTCGVQNFSVHRTGDRPTVISGGRLSCDDVTDRCSDATRRTEGNHGNVQTSSTSCDLLSPLSRADTDGDGALSKSVDFRQPGGVPENKGTAPSALHSQATDLASIVAASVQLGTGALTPAPSAAPHHDAQTGLHVRHRGGHVHNTDSPSVSTGPHPEASGIDNTPSGTGDINANSTKCSIPGTGSTRNTNTNGSGKGGSTAADLGLEELCVLGSALAELRYRPERPWLHRALAAAGAAAVSASAAMMGMDMVDRDGTPIDHVSAGRDGYVAKRLPSSAGTVSSLSRLASQLAALLWRWAAVAANPGGTAVAAAAASVELFAGEMVAATGPLLSVMGPSDLVRCAEGMVALQQLMARQRGCGCGSDRDNSDQTIRWSQERPDHHVDASDVVNAAERATAVSDTPQMMLGPSACSAGGWDDGVRDSDDDQALTGSATLSSAAVRRADMLERSVSLLVEDSCRSDRYINGCGGRSGNDNGSEKYASVSLASAVSVTEGDMKRPAATSAAVGRSSMRTWWLQVERASANVLLTRPSLSPQPLASLPTRQQQRPEPQLKPYNLSVMLRCMATAGHVPSSAWLQRYCQHTLPLLPSYKAQDVAITMWAFAHMRLSLGAYNTASSVRVAQSTAAPPRTSPRAQAGSCSAPLTARSCSDSYNSNGGIDTGDGCVGVGKANALAHQLQRQPGVLPGPVQPPSPSTVPYLSVTAERPDNIRLIGYRQWPQCQQSHVQPRELAVRIRAPPALGSWMEAAVGMLPPLLRHCTSADLQNITWALVTLDFPPPAGWLRQYELATQPRLPYLSGAALLYSLWAYGKFGHAPSDSYMEAALQALRPGLLGADACMPAAPQASSSPPPPPPKGSPHNPVAVVTPAAKSTDTLFQSSAQPPADGDSHGYGKAGGGGDTGARGGGRCGVVELLDAQSLALLLHSLAQLDYLPAEWWTTEYLQAVLKELPSMSARGLAILLRALATLQVYPARLWLDAVLDTAAQQLPHFSEQQLESFLSAFADLAPRTLPSLTPLQRFLWACLRVAPDNRKVGAYYRLLAAYFPAPASTQVSAVASTVTGAMAIAGGGAAPLVSAPSAVILAADQVPSQKVRGRAVRRFPHAPVQPSSTAAVAAFVSGSAQVSDRHAQRPRSRPSPSAAAAAVGEAAVAPTPRLAPQASSPPSQVPATLHVPVRKDSAHDGDRDSKARPYTVHLGRHGVRPAHQTVWPRRRGAGAAVEGPTRILTVPRQLQIAPPKADTMQAAAATHLTKIPERLPD